MESCLYAVEVKSKLTAVNLSDAIENARSTRALEHVNTFHYSGTKSEKTGMPAPNNVLFAFDSDLEGHMKTELDRYLELDHAESPAITVLCVVGKGYWAVTSKGWRYYKPSEQFGEVLGFLAGVSNTIPKLLSAKGCPQFGSYLFDENTGVLVKPAS